MNNKHEKRGLEASDIIAESLLEWGVDVVFGLPGDGINGFIESLRRRKDRIRFVLVRHEESAAFMACAYAKYTGRLGVCVATSGPGAIHLLNGLYDAKMDNTSVLAITGSTYSDLMNSDYQQDVNLVRLFSDVSVYNTMINKPEQAEMAVDIACRAALSKKGVSHLTIPIDVQEATVEGYSRHKVEGHTSKAYTEQIVPGESVLKKAAEILNSGRKVIMLVGQGAIGAEDEVLAVAERLQSPIVKALLGKAVIPDYNPYCLGGLGMLGTEPATDAMTETDTLLMVGTSFPYMEYLPKPDQARGVQIDIKPDKIGLRFPVEVGMVGDAKLTLSALLPYLDRRRSDGESAKFLWSKQEAMKKWFGLLRERSTRIDKPIKPQLVAAAVSEELQDNAIVSVDSGTNTVWAAQHIMLRAGMKFSVSGTLASMACGLPYAIAAQIAFPDRQCIAFVGDGGLNMLMSEFATAVQYHLPITVIVIKNNTLGMIRWEQMAFLGNPEYVVEFSPVDYVKFAESCGGRGYSIKEPEQVRPIIHKAMAERKDGPVMVEAYVDPFEPPMPPKVGMDFVRNVAEAMARGQPYSKRIGLTMFRDKVHEALRNAHSHDSTDVRAT